MDYPFKKHIIITGHFGSGKTNIAISLAFKLASMGKKCALIDIDIVNPYFRAFDAVNELTKAGIRVIAPTFANTNLEVSFLPAEMNAAFDSDFDHAIFDVGGSGDGANALGRYNERFIKQGYTMLYVINKFRPQTSTTDECAEMLREIENAGRLKAEGIINNSNLGDETTEDIVKKSLDFANELSKKVNIPVAFTTALRDLGIKENNIFDIEIYTRKFFD